MIKINFNPQQKKCHKSLHKNNSRLTQSIEIKIMRYLKLMITKIMSQIKKINFRQRLMIPIVHNSKELYLRIKMIYDMFLT